MDVHRFFVGWLLVVGLVGVYAVYPDEQSAEAHSKYPHLNDGSSVPNLVNKDSSGNEYAVSETTNEERLHESSDSRVLPYTMSPEDYNWHFVEGEEALRRLSEETHKEKVYREGLKKQMQPHHGIPGQRTRHDKFLDWIRYRNYLKQMRAQLRVEKAEKRTRKKQKITKERVPQYKLNKSGPNTRTYTRKSSQVKKISK